MPHNSALYAVRRAIYLRTLTSSNGNEDTTAIIDSIQDDESFTFEGYTNQFG